MASITCGDCRQTHRSVAEVKDCYAETAEQEAQAKAEWEGEARYERWLENGGAHAEVISWEAQEDDRRAAMGGIW